MDNIKLITIISHFYILPQKVIVSPAKDKDLRHGTRFPGNKCLTQEAAELCSYPLRMCIDWNTWSMLQDREEIGKDAHCCFCDLSITRWFLTLPGDGQYLFLPWGQERCGSTHGLGREKSFICKCGFNFSEGISLASIQVPTHAASRPSYTSLPRQDLWDQVGSGAKPWQCM